MQENLETFPNTAQVEQSGVLGEVPFPGVLDHVLTDREFAQRIGVVNPFTLPSVSLGQISKLPWAAGVYFLLVRNEVFYVGRSRNLQLRWRTHKHLAFLKYPEARLAYLVIPSGPFYGSFQSRVELHFIHKLNPLLNRKMIGPRLLKKGNGKQIDA